MDKHEAEQWKWVIVASDTQTYLYHLFHPFLGHPQRKAPLPSSHISPQHCWPLTSSQVNRSHKLVDLNFTQCRARFEATSDKPISQTQLIAQVVEYAFREHFSWSNFKLCAKEKFVKTRWVCRGSLWKIDPKRMRLYKLRSFSSRFTRLQSCKPVKR